MSTPDKFWYELQLTAARSIREILAAGFMADCLGSIDEEEQSCYFFQPELQAKIDGYLGEYRERFSFRYTWLKRNSEPWHLAWKDNFTPVSVCGKILVVPDWDENSRADVLIRIKPGMAFGTGHHETTFLMLEALLMYLKAGMTVLDVGSGSGILALAALKMSSGKISCVEFDEDCRDNFHENFALNDIPSAGLLHISDILEWDDFSKDLILANVNFRVIKMLLPKLAGLKQPIILSGLLETDETSITELCLSLGLTPGHTAHKGEWIRMDLNI